MAKKKVSKPQKRTKKHINRSLKLFFLVFGVFSAIILAVYFSPLRSYFLTQQDGANKQSNVNDETAKWQTYTNTKYGYSLKYPNNWFIKDLTTISALNILNAQYINDKETIDFNNYRVALIIDGIDIKQAEKFLNYGDMGMKNKAEITKTQLQGKEIVKAIVIFSQLDFKKNQYVEEDKSYRILIPILNNTLTINAKVDDINVVDQILSTFKFLDQPGTTSSNEENGVELKDIKYKLPQGWKAKLENNSLFISPTESGGFLLIKAYDYPGNIGRREYYCQISKYCIEGTSYFTEMNIGNISGYKANALDNSGGGPEYFGAKGNKFYIITSFSPSSQGEFAINSGNVLNSLVF